MTIRTDSRVNIYKETSVIYEGEPPDDLNIEYFYSNEDAKFQIESSVDVTGTNNITIVGELDGSPVTEVIVVLGEISEGIEFFDLITSISFAFDDTTNIKIRAITSSGGDNPVNLLQFTNIAARIIDVRWSRTLSEMGVIFEKSKLVYLPLFLSLDNTFVIEYKGQNYSIFNIIRGERVQEIIITRLDEE